MAKKLKCPECKEGQPEWMGTYGDLVTLLMCFFVLLFAMAEIDSQKFDAVMKSFQGSAGLLSGGTTLQEEPLAFDGMPEEKVAQDAVLELDNSSKSEDQIKSETEEKFEDLEEAINNYIVENDLSAGIVVGLEDSGLVIRFEDNVLFDPGEAIVRPESYKVLNFLGELLNTEELISESVRVEGHTDNIPTNTSRYPSNWELSSGRAINVTKYLQETIGVEGNRLSPTGYGEYHPIADNSTSEGRSRNRRVDIVILKENYETYGAIEKTQSSTE